MFKASQNRLALAAAIVTAASASMAAGSGVDFTQLTGSVDFSTVVTAVLAIAAVKVLPMVAVWGSRKVLGMIGG